MSKNRPIVFIYNCLEDIVDTFRVLSEEKKTELESQENNYFNQNELLGILSEFPNRQKYYLIFPEPINQCFIDYACEMLEIDASAIEIMVPIKKTVKIIGSISERIVKDQKLLQRLDQIPSFDLQAFTYTDEFSNICEIFKGKTNILTKKQAIKKVKRLGTKPGIRQLAQNLHNPDVQMPKGKIFYKSETSYEEAICYAATKLQNEGVVIKTEKLYAGRGVLIIKRAEVQDLSQKQLKQYLREKMFEPYWELFDIVVQDLVDVDFSIGPPCVEIYLSDLKKVELVWISAMIVQNEKDFIGVESADQIYRKQIREKLIKAVMALGDVFYDLGYRGYINIDFNIDKQGKVFLGQANVRRSASLFIHNFMRSMHGRQYNKNHYIMTHDINSQKLLSLPFSDMLNFLEKQGLSTQRPINMEL